MNKNPGLSFFGLFSLLTFSKVPEESLGDTWMKWHEQDTNIHLIKHEPLYAYQRSIYF